jgi:cytochrome c biogenesis protein CcmG/thiol:disulfide interchange protein DsbE
MRRFLIPGVIVVVAVGLLAVLTFGVSNQSETSSIDAQVASGRFPMAPNATMALPVLGTSVKRTLASFRGRVVVLNVFASWCQPCAAEAPLLAAEQATLAKRGGTLIGVTYEDNPVSSEQFARQYHMTYPILRDVSGDLVRSFGTTGVPETFVINRQGRIQALRRYQVTGQWLTQALGPILAERS